MKRYVLTAGLLLVASMMMPHSARAQYYPNPYNPYLPRSAGPGIGQGAALSGSAQVMNAYGDVVVQQENARIQREQANQAKIDTKRKAFDEMMYEKANTPTYIENAARDNANILNRIMNFPNRSEVVEGKALNTMLPFLQSLSTYGTQGSPVMLPQSAVRELNVSGTGTSSVGILRNGGRVDWPLAMITPQQKKLDKLLPAAYDAAGAGELTPKLMKDIRTEMTSMREDMRKRLKAEEIETSSYLQAIEFYHTLENSVNALERPDARKQISGVYAARGRNVQELVDYMTENGLKFAPAAPGQENAYQVVNDAFVRYARIAQSSSGFQTANSMPSAPQPPYKK
jgi:hypothetical protein